ncbi:MAG: hypothetical protein WBA74_06200 [Cyclobacteriaceae bacterium]
MKTKDSLSVFWSFKDGQEEVNGMYLFGFCIEKSEVALDASKLYNIWDSSVADFRLNKYMIDEHSILSIKVYIKVFPKPNSWLIDLQNIFELMRQNGSIISWCGGEDSSPNPIIFNSRAAAGNVYACFTTETGLLCNSELNDELVYLKDEQLNNIYNIFRKYAKNPD